MAEDVFIIANTQGSEVQLRGLRTPYNTKKYYNSDDQNFYELKFPSWQRSALTQTLGCSPTKKDDKERRAGPK